MTYAQLLNQPAFVIIIRCIYEREESQAQAFRALKARGLWLSDKQKQQAGRSQ